jgi:hypothetical protein
MIRKDVTTAAKKDFFLHLTFCDKLERHLQQFLTITHHSASGATVLKLVNQT